MQAIQVLPLGASWFQPQVTVGVRTVYDSIPIAATRTAKEVEWNQSPPVTSSR